MDDTYRCWNVGAGDTFHGSIEVIKCFTLDDLSTDFTADTKGWETTLDNEEPERRGCPVVMSGMERFLTCWFF